VLSGAPASANDITFRESQLARALLAVLSKRPQAPPHLPCAGDLSSNYVRSGHWHGGCSAPASGRQKGSRQGPRAGRNGLPLKRSIGCSSSAARVSRECKGAS
jgi:hypothetical protein